eukprot:661921-Amphidinium_carterae.1
MMLLMMMMMMRSSWKDRDARGGEFEGRGWWWAPSPLKEKYWWWLVSYVKPKTKNYRGAFLFSGGNCGGPNFSRAFLFSG